MGVFTKRAVKDKDFEFRFVEATIHGCCGVKVIYDLENYSSATVKQYKTNAVQKLERMTGNREFEGLAVININSEMKRVWHPILLKAGFKLKSSANNWNTENNIHLYTKIIHKAKRGH